MIREGQGLGKPLGKVVAGQTTRKQVKGRIVEKTAENVVRVKFGGEPCEALGLWSKASHWRV